MLSGIYTNQGVSRYDKHWKCYRCCHCDGLAYLTPLERYLATTEHRGERDYAQTMAEAGEAHDLGFRQYLHYRCGVYAVPAFLAQDLDTLANLDVADDAVFAEILSHYTVATAGELKADDITKAWERVHVTRAQLEQFERRDRNNMALPAANDPNVVLTLDYTSRWQRQPQCARCDANVEERWPGLAYRRQGQSEPLYLHYDCYNIVAAKREQDRQDRMMSQFDPADHWRLAQLVHAWGRVPVQEFLEWDAEVKLQSLSREERDTKCKEFLAFYEQRVVSP
jgi:hypothetical protein